MVVSQAVGWAEIERGRRPDWAAAREHVRSLPAEALHDLLRRLGHDPGEAPEQLRRTVLQVVDWCEAGWEGADPSFVCGALHGSRILIGTGDALAALMILHESGAGEAAGFWRPERQQP